jgi:hypothetical protein
MGPCAIKEEGQFIQAKPKEIAQLNALHAIAENPSIMESIEAFRNTVSNIIYEPRISTLYLII